VWIEMQEVSALVAAGEWIELSLGVAEGRSLA